MAQYFGFSYDEDKAPQYDYDITYSYTNKDPVKVQYKNQKVPILTIPASPEPVHLKNAEVLSRRSSL